MRITIGKALSLLVAIACFVMVVIMHGGLDPDIAAFALVLLVCLVLIWFGDLLGAYVGPMMDGDRISRTTPGGCLASLGWIGLLGFAAAWIWFRLSAP
ncbi:MAG: hypothetical protein SYC29_18710 [Planctomycetota bacterium]|nr:hypothetical protein [Planctomycetota bacterium]